MLHPLVRICFVLVAVPLIAQADPVAPPAPFEAIAIHRNTGLQADGDGLRSSCH